MIRILITGAHGFIGENFQLFLRDRADVQVRLYLRQDGSKKLADLLNDTDIVYHLAGVNRPQDTLEFQADNVDLTSLLAENLVRIFRSTGKGIPVVFTSSIQATLDTPYGLSKRQAEDILWRLAENYPVPVYIFRLPNVFGKWCRPNYNSVVATFCHNIARDQTIQINDPEAKLTLVYVDDVMKEFVEILEGNMSAPIVGTFVEVGQKYQTTVGLLAELLKGFRKSRDTLMSDHVGCGLVRALYSTYVSYLPVEDFSYAVPQHSDSRGKFVEILKTPDSGQFSYFTAHVGVTRGGHYHHSKTEKFLVIRGQALFRFRHMQTGDSHELRTSGVVPQIVETVPGWTHDITNVGSEEMIVMLWANEVFDRDNPDTFRCPL